MTVAELIEMLKGMPQDLPVTAYDGDYLLLIPETVRVEAAPDALYCRRTEDMGAVEDAEGPHVRIG